MTASSTSGDAPTPEPLADDAVPSNAVTPRSPRCSARRQWLFRLLAVAFSLAPLILLELALRLSGYGYDTRLIVPARHAASAASVQLNPHTGRAYYGSQGLAGPEPRHFEIPKPPAVYRIVVVGGSTVAGFPYPFELAMPRHLEVILSQQFPERRFEVLNAGITSINSCSEVDIVRQAVACAPDLIVVHSGHNEFYGPGGTASNSSRLAPALYPLLQALQRQRSFQLALSLGGKPADSHLVETLPADVSIPLDGEVFQRTESRYAGNLQAIVEITSRAGIPLVLSTVPSNLRDLSPLQANSSVPLTGSEADEQAAQLKEAMRHISYRKYDLALDVLTRARQADPAHPLLAFRQAQCLEMLDRNEEAAAAYALAADLDGCRFRAPSSFAAVVRRAAERAPSSVHFCDVAARFQEVTQFPAPGNDLFLEHVHYNLEGHWQAARFLAECIVEQVLEEQWDAARLPDARQRDALLRVTPFDHLVADAQTIGILGVWPFNLSADRDVEVQLAKQRWRTTFDELSQMDQRLFTNQSLESMTQNVLPVMGHAYLASGRESLALTLFQRHIARRPWDSAGYVGAVMALRAQGKTREAQEVVDRVLKVLPSDPQVQELLKASEAEAGR